MLITQVVIISCKNKERKMQLILVIAEMVSFISEGFTTFCLY